MNKLDQAAKTFVYILLSWRGILTFGFCSLGVLLYYSVSWTPLQLLLARVLVFMLEFGGHSASRIGYNIIMPDFMVHIDSLCTYIPVILIGLPFMWRGDQLVRDILRMILFAVTISMVNVARIYFAIVWHAEGLPWKYAHDYINDLICIPAIAVLIIVLWLKAMSRQRCRDLRISPWTGSYPSRLARSEVTGVPGS